MNMHLEWEIHQTALVIRFSIARNVALKNDLAKLHNFSIDFDSK